MAPRSDELVTLVERYGAAVTSGDVDAIADFFAEDAVQIDPMPEPPRVGRAAIREFFASAMQAGGGMDFQPSDIHPSGDHVAFHANIVVSLESGKMVIDVIETFQVNADGKIAEVRAYWDDTTISFA